MNDKKIIICDIDDVLWDMVTTWCLEYNQLSTTKNIVTPKSFDTWDISKVVGKDEACKFYNFLKQDEFWDKVVANQDKDLLRNTYNHILWLSDKYDFYIATATDYRCKHKLDLFFDIFDCVPKDKLIVIKDKWLLNADIIIDDKAETLFEFDKKGARCVKINKPWNYWFNCEGYQHFIFAAKKLLKEV